MLVTCSAKQASQQRGILSDAGTDLQHPVTQLDTRCVRITATIVGMLAKLVGIHPTESGPHG